MYIATIVKKKNDPTIYIRFSNNAPATGGDVEVIDILLRKDEETIDKFKERVVKYVQEKVN